MTRFFLLSGFFLAVAAFAARAEEVQVMDPLFGKVCLRVQVPAGWKFEYKFDHPKPGYACLAYRAWDPETGLWIQQFPINRFVNINRAEGFAAMYAKEELASVPREFIRSPLGAAGCIQEIINSMQVENIELVSDSRNEEDRANRQKIYDMFARNDQFGSLRATADNHSAVINYDSQGRRFKEILWVFTNYIFTTLQMAPVSYGMGFNNPGFLVEQVQWDMTLLSSGVPVENDEFVNSDPEYLRKCQNFMASVTIYDQVWEAEVQAYQTRQRNQEMQAQANQINQNLQHQQKMWDSQIATQRQVFAERQAVIQNRADSISRTSSTWTDVFRGVEKTVSPVTGKTLEIEYGPKHVWVDADNRRFYTENGLDNPNRMHGSSGTYQQLR